MTEQSPPSLEHSGGHETTRKGSLVITNLIKLGGLAVALNETLISGAFGPKPMALAAFMMTGAQVSEQILLAAIDRFFGGQSSAPKT